MPPAKESTFYKVTRTLSASKSLPQFPQFKTVELSDQELVEAYLANFLPYSDFNFISLWSWDTSKERKISVLNNNLVVIFTDYGTNEPFYSFLGTNDLDETAIMLLEHCVEAGFPKLLRLVPHTAANMLNHSSFIIEEDRDNFDYIYSLKTLSLLEGSSFQTKRYKARKFIKRNPHIAFDVLPKFDQESSALVFDVVESWRQRKTESGKEFEFEHEMMAIKRLFSSGTSKNFEIAVLRSSHGLVGFIVLEILPRDYAICHFWKCYDRYAGIYDYLIKEVATYLLSCGIQYLNFEQDLGIANLRSAKMGYRPVEFLKKYKVSFKSDTDGMTQEIT